MTLLARTVWPRTTRPPSGQRRLARPASLSGICAVAALLTSAGSLMVRAPATAASPEFGAEQLEFFESDIRPLLVEHCYGCHSASAKKSRGGLQLDHRAGLLEGGSRGPAVLPGSPDQSLLVAAVSYEDADLQMPPSGKLSENDVALIKKWVKLGLPDPRERELSGSAPLAGMSIEEGRDFWSMRPLIRASSPTVQNIDAVADPIDTFILAKLEAAGLKPSPRADRASLLRRATFDLIGLPPTPEDVAAFVSDESPDAYTRLIDRLLATNQYGERWARFWLDKARYTDRLAGWDGSQASPWLYRDWVVSAFNADVPYDEFITRQLATDLLPSTGPEDHPALGLLGLSPTYWKELKLDNSLVKGVVAEEWEERVDTIGRTFLGLTLACARCHDHKFDPIKTTDYYALAGVVASTRMKDRPIVSDERWQPIQAARETVARLTKERQGLQEKKARSESEEKRRREINAEIDAAKRSVADYDLPLAAAVEESSIHVLANGPNRTKIEYRKGEPRDLRVHLRGDPTKLGETVPRGFISVLSTGPRRSFTQGSGRRELADAIVDDAAPLTARVIVNRIWGEHFGRGIVATTSNFGTQGSRPSHPELLDHLAARFIASGWSLKWLHRTIMLSATYQQSSRMHSDSFAIDPENRLLWRMNRRRLEFESWRDAALAASGRLDLQVGGAPKALSTDENRRRTLYGLIDRRELDTMLRLHDFPDPAGHSPRREPTTTPVQQLFVLNSPFIRSHARHLHDRLTRRGLPTTDEKVRQVYLWLFGRRATAQQIRLARVFVGAENRTGSQHAAEVSTTWQQYLQALLASNEFAFVD